VSLPRLLAPDHLPACVSTVSSDDLAFASFLPNAVHSHKFYAAVQHIIEQGKEEASEAKPYMLNFQYPLRKSAMLSPGSFLVLSEKFVKTLPKSTNCDNVGKTSVFKNLIGKLNHLLADPLSIKRSYSFDTIVEFFSMFRIMSPIDPSRLETSANTQLAILSLHNCLTKACNVGMVGVENLMERQTAKESLVRDTCKEYLHYGWCRHAMAWAKWGKTITSYPITMLPVSHGKKRKKGRPTDAHGGGALCKDDRA